MAALYTMLKCKCYRKVVNTVLVSQAIQCYDQVRKQDHSTPCGVYFTVFSLKDKGVRVNTSTWTGRLLTSASSYMNVWVSAVYTFICHDLLTVILGIFVVNYRLLQSTTATPPRYVKFTVQ